MKTRTVSIQIIATPELRAKVEADANKLNLSISSMGELILGSYFAKKETKTLYNDYEV